jgi:hypothetical protein
VTPAQTTAALVAIAHVQATAPAPTRGRPIGEDEVNADALIESWAEEREFWRRNRPLGRDEWARREEGDL